MNPKLGLDHHPTTTTTTNFSATSRRARKLEFCTDIHYTNLIQVTNCHYDICPGNICLGDICPYQEYLSCYWPDFLDLIFFYPKLSWPKVFWTWIFFNQNFFGSYFFLTKTTSITTSTTPIIMDFDTIEINLVLSYWYL